MNLPPATPDLVLENNALKMTIQTYSREMADLLYQRERLKLERDGANAQLKAANTQIDMLVKELEMTKLSRNALEDEVSELREQLETEAVCVHCDK